MSIFKVEQKQTQELQIADEDTEDSDDQNEEKFNGKTDFKNILASDTMRINQRNYFTREKLNIRDITFDTLQNNILAVDHIILCGMVPNLINFVLPLRARYLGSYFTIVILNTNEPTEKQWSQISIFPEIYFIQGSALKDKDLKRANLMKAKQVVILSPSVMEITENRQIDQSNQKQSISKEQEHLLDARTIFKYKAVQRMRPDIRIITELVNPQNMSFLLSHPKDYALMRKHGYNHSPLFASGEIYISSMMDSLCCQAYYNSALITVLNLLLIGNESSNQADEFGGKSSNLFHLQAPYAYVGETFQKLFKYMCQKQNIIVIGLYRLPGCQDNQLPYVWTNPDPETIISEQDTLLVLAPEKPNENFMEWGGPLETRNQDSKQQQLKHTTYIGNQFQKGHEDENANMLILAKDYDRENQKNKLMIQESQMVQERVNQIIDQIEDLKKDTDELRQMLINREDVICESLKGIFQENIAELLKISTDQKAEENNDQTSEDEIGQFGSSEQMHLKASRN